MSAPYYILFPEGEVPLPVAYEKQFYCHLSFLLRFTKRLKFCTKKRPIINRSNTCDRGDRWLFIMGRDFLYLILSPSNHSF